MSSEEWVQCKRCGQLMGELVARYHRCDRTRHDDGCAYLRPIYDGRIALPCSCGADDNEAAVLS